MNIGGVSSNEAAAQAGRVDGDKKTAVAAASEAAPVSRVSQKKRRQDESQAKPKGRKKSLKPSAQSSDEALYDKHGKPCKTNQVDISV